MVPDLSGLVETAFGALTATSKSLPAESWHALDLLGVARRWLPGPGPAKQCEEGSVPECESDAGIGSHAVPLCF